MILRSNAILLLSREIVNGFVDNPRVFFRRRFWSIVYCLEISVDICLDADSFRFLQFTLCYSYVSDKYLDISLSFFTLLIIFPHYLLFTLIGLG